MWSEVGRRKQRLLAVALIVFGLAGWERSVSPAAVAQHGALALKTPAQLLDGASGADWPAPGRTHGEQHFSPLSAIDSGNVRSLGLAWSMDLPPGNSVTQPIEVGGTLYFTTGYSVVHAVDAASGRELWVYDPKAPQASGRILRAAWGSRGVAWWNGKIYVGTQDGRLIAIDAAAGRPIWSVKTTSENDGRYITGAPRVFAGKVIIGNGGADVAAIRGYVTAYDAESGRQAWRFYTVPGNPAAGFENRAMEMAAHSWSGEWWKFGGGGTVWNAITYDPDTDTVFIGTGNGAPWNRKIRSNGQGDNLFLCSIVALSGATGAYKWHYQVNPGESWDYSADMDMELADLTIDGRPRKVLITAPKNGFLYVIDRVTGQFISAKPYVKETWATSIDQRTGRPVDAPNSRYENGPFLLAPSSVGAHSWLPMAFSKQTNLVYIPAIEQEATFSDAGVDIAHWQRRPDFMIDGGVGNMVKAMPGKSEAALVAWDPVRQRQVWRVPMAANISAGVLATGGNLVFQGDVAGHFNAYDARTGHVLWSFDAKAPIMGPPISYSVGGVQYVSVLTGAGTSLVAIGENVRRFGISYRDQRRRVLTFALGRNGVLPASPPYVFTPIEDPAFRPDPAAEGRGEFAFDVTCLMCHGVGAIAAGAAPDLRTSAAIVSPETFDAIVKDGGLVDQGMPRFDDLSDATRHDIRQYLRSRAATARLR